jgi:phytanoyl-CoA hydroxylase
MLSHDQIEQYGRDGYLVLPGFASSESCAGLKERALSLVDSFQPCTDHAVYTPDATNHSAGAQFLASATGMWCFFHDDERRVIDRIGHALHDLDPVFERFSYTPELAVLAEELGLVDAVAVQSSYAFGQPGTGRLAECRQDATFFYTDPITVTGFWFAIDDATVDNGCLWVAPGGHRTPLRTLLLRAGDPPWEGYETGTEFDDLDDTPLPTAPDDLVPLEVPAGTMIVRHGLLPYWHDVNRTDSTRHAFSMHCVAAEVDYPEWNWLQRPDELPLRRLDHVATPGVDELIAAIQASQT